MKFGQGGNLDIAALDLLHDDLCLANVMSHLDVQYAGVDRHLICEILMLPWPVVHFSPASWVPNAGASAPLDAVASTCDSDQFGSIWFHASFLQLPGCGCFGRATTLPFLNPGLGPSLADLDALVCHSQ